jgi:hypothetical protein
MIEKEANANKDEKRRREKEAPCASFIDLTKRAFEIQAIEPKDKLFVKENQIMSANLSIMGPVSHAWFEKKQMIIRERDM